MEWEEHKLLFHTLSLLQIWIFDGSSDNVTTASKIHIFFVYIQNMLSICSSFKMTGIVLIYSQSCCHHLYWLLITFKRQTPFRKMGLSVAVFMVPLADQWEEGKIHVQRCESAKIDLQNCPHRLQICSQSLQICLYGLQTSSLELSQGFSTVWLYSMFWARGGAPLVKINLFRVLCHQTTGQLLSSGCETLQLILFSLILKKSPIQDPLLKWHNE